MKPVLDVCLSVAIAAVALLALVEASHAGDRSVRDIVYRQVGETSLKLDLYLVEGSQETPKKESGSRSPCIVWVHGGAWRGGTKEDVPIRELTNRGYAIASVEYRLSTEAKFPAQTEDIHAAIRFLKTNADKYGLHSRRIAVTGSSAGGHLAALVGVTKDIAEVGGAESGRESEVSAIVSFYGTSNLESILDQSTPHGLSVRVPALKLLLGGSPDERADLARLASPVAHVGADDPPLLLIHGDADPQMPMRRQSSSATRIASRICPSNSSPWRAAFTAENGSTTKPC